MNAMKRRQCYLDHQQCLSWHISHHHPNLFFAVSALVFSFLLTAACIQKKGTGNDFRLILAVMLTVLFCIGSAEDIIRRIKGNYITLIRFMDDGLTMKYRNGTEKEISYHDIGFLDFHLTTGRGFHKRYYPHFLFYKKDPSSNVLDDVVYKKGYLLFCGEVLDLESYLLLKDVFRQKGLHYYEPPKTLQFFRY